MAEQVRLQIKGLVRFSYLAEGGFNLSRRGPDEVRATLYDPTRLDRRFALFEALALPSLRAQTDADFHVSLLITDDFPQRDRLESLVADDANIRVTALPPGRHIAAIADAYAALPDDEAATHTATFRLDDDDAMHRDAVARIRELAQAILPVRAGAKPFAIAFNRGFYLYCDEEGAPIREYYERTPLGVGMAMVAPAGARQNVFRRNHRNIGEFMDTYTEVARPMYIRSVHAGNDSTAKPTGRAGKMGEGRIARLVRREFGLDPDRLRAL